jgi:hypothetical protein
MQKLQIESIGPRESSQDVNTGKVIEGQKLSRYLGTKGLEDNIAA